MKIFYIILVLLIIFLIFRYFVAGKGNKQLICPSTFGFGWDNNCVKQMGYTVLDNNTIQHL